MQFLFKFLILSFSLIVAGFLVTLILFKFELKKLFSSYLFIKILMWIPITGLVLVIYSSDNRIKFVILLLIAISIFIEAIKKIGKKDLRIYFYPLLIISGLLFSIFFAKHQDFNKILLSIIFSVSISDVFAFFFGNFFGFHKLPEFINSNKSWEGFLGEIIGASAGLLLLSIVFESPLPLILSIPIGLGAGVGDLMNSYIKRRLRIKDWGSAIPGHGGFTDRLCGTSLAFIFTYLFASIFWF